MKRFELIAIALILIVVLMVFKNAIIPVIAESFSKTADKISVVQAVKI